MFADLFGSAADLLAFWEGSKNCEWYRRHPVSEIAAAPSSCHPVGVYGDDSGVFQRQQILVLTWGGVAVQNKTLGSRLLFSAVLYKFLVPDKSLAEIYKAFAWSLEWLEIGVHPDVDHNRRAFSLDYCPNRFAKAGTPLTASGFKAILSELRGDGK